VSTARSALYSPKCLVGDFSEVRIAPILYLVTVGVNLAQNNASLHDALPFVAATVLIAALSVLSYLLFRRRAQRTMPKMRDWMNTNSWLVNIIVYVVFIYLIL